MDNHIFVGVRDVAGFRKSAGTDLVFKLAAK